MARPRTIVILQSSYIPWKGYFDLMARADEFILLDSVQYTPRDWRNRNRLKCVNGTKWLTVPVTVRHSRNQRIDQTLVADREWPQRHWTSIAAWYRAAPFFDAYSSTLENLFLGATEPRLSQVNRRFLEALSPMLGIETALSWSTDYEACGTRTERLLTLCQAAGATRYLSGPSARDYLDVASFAEAGIAVDWMSYDGYPEYPQLHPPFSHQVSVIDLLLNVGPEAPRYMLGLG